MNTHIHHRDYIIEWRRHVADIGKITFAVWITKGGQQLFYHHPCLTRSTAIELARWAIDKIVDITNKTQEEEFKALTERIKRHNENPAIYYNDIPDDL